MGGLLDPVTTRRGEPYAESPPVAAAGVVDSDGDEDSLFSLLLDEESPLSLLPLDEVAAASLLSELSDGRLGRL